MESATKADLKELLDEFRSEFKQSIRQSIAEAFGTWKPVVEAQASAVQDARDLLQQHVYRDKGDGAEEASAADPLDPSVLKDCSMEVLGHDITEWRSAPAPTTAPTVHTATVDIDPVLAAPVVSGDEQAISGLAPTPATCLMVCVPRHPAAARVLVVSSPPPPTEYSFDTNIIPVAAVPLAKDQPIASKVHVHRPLPWPSFLDCHANGDETRPLPWPSFSVFCDYLSSELKESVVLDLMRSSSYSLICDEWELSPWDPGQEVVSDFTKIFYSQANSDIYLKNLMLQSLSDFSPSQARYIFTGSQINLVLTAASRAAHWLVSDVCDGSTVSSLIAVLWDEWVLQPWEFGQQADFSYDQFTCANNYTPCFPGNFVTDGQIQDFAAYSTLHLFLSGFSVSFRPVVMLDLQIVGCCSHCVYLQKRQMDKVGIEGATLNTISSSVDHCRLNRSESVLAHSVDMEVYCSIFPCTSGGTVCESILTPTIFSFVGGNLICFSSSKVCALLVGFLRSARMKSEMSKDVSTHATNVVIAVGVSHSSTVRSRFVKDQAWLSQWFILMCWPEEQLLATRPLPIASCSVPNSGLQFHWCMSLDLVQGLFFLAAPTVTCTPVLSLSNILADWHLQNQSTLTCPAAVCITELEGAIGDMETMPFIEALHQLLFSLVVKAFMHSTVVCSLKLPIQCVASSDFKVVAATSAPEAHATMQLSVIEVYKHDLGLGVACTQEFNTDTPGRVVLYMPEVAVIIDPECQIVLTSFCEKTQQLGFLLQEVCQDWQFVHSAIDRVQPILLLVHADHQSYYQTTFQGGRDVSFEQVATSHNIKVRRLQWDPGGFSAMSAWGQAEFQGGRDVSNIACLQLVGLPTWADNDGPSPDNPPRAIAATYIFQEAIKQDPSWITNPARRRRRTPYPSSSYFPFNSAQLCLYRILATL